MQFSPELNESSLPDSEAMLLPYVRFLKDKERMEGFLFPMRKNMRVVATDVAPSKVSCRRGLVAYPMVMPEVSTLHCVIQGQRLALYYVSPCLNESSQHIVAANNQTKSNLLKDETAVLHGE
uniref:Uncharacterized protein n=1 Tax=Trichuris muris TaxID=70415 RepID=A0A5S6QXP4_TRIMR